jgi:hypothetical protein
MNFWIPAVASLPVASTMLLRRSSMVSASFVKIRLPAATYCPWVVDSNYGELEAQLRSDETMVAQLVIGKKVDAALHLGK